jgi:ribosomal protein S18 acetylase RimI-like enzyme
MTTEFRKAILPDELRSLLAFDAKVFPKADRFSKGDWQSYESHWMIVNGVKAGCCAFARDVDFEEDLPAGENHLRRGSLYIASTGILPRFQGLGFGRMLKCWEISYARYHGFARIVTNTRKRNRPMIELNKKFGFRVVRVSPGYYSNPSDSTVVMELKL